MIKSGKLDVMPFASITKEREAFARFSVPYRYEKVGLLVRKGDKRTMALRKISDVISLGLRIGYHRGGYFGDEFKEFLSRPEAERHLFPYDETSQGMGLLKAERIDLIIGDPAWMRFHVNQMGMGHLYEDHPYTIQRSPVHFMMSRKSVSAEYLTQFNKVLSKLLAGDAYREVFGPVAIEPEASPDS